MPPFASEPLLEGRILHANAIEQIAAVKPGSSAQFVGSIRTCKSLELKRIDIDSRSVKRNCVMVRREWRRTEVGQRVPQLSQRLAQAIARLLVAPVTPQQVCQLVAAPRSPHGQGQIC